MIPTGGHPLARGRSRRAAMRLAAGRPARPASGAVGGGVARHVPLAAAG